MAGGSSSMSFSPPTNSSVRYMWHNKVAKNTSGQRHEVRWQHDTPVTDWSRDVKYNYCHNDYINCVFLFNQQLVGQW